MSSSPGGGAAGTPSASDVEGLVAVLNGILATDNAVRGQAEAAFQQLREQNCGGLLRCLLAVLGSCPDESTRQQAAVTIKQVLRDFILGKPDSSWTRLDDGTRAAVKAGLLTALQNEPATAARRSVCDTLSDLAAELIARDEWPELPPFLMTLVDAGAAAPLQAAGWKILADLVPQLTEALAGHRRALAEVVARTLEAPSDPAVLIEALAFLAAMVESQPNSVWKPCQAACPHIVAFLDRLNRAAEGGKLSGADASNATEVLIKLVEIADSNAGFFRPVAAPLVAVAVALGRNAALDDDLRQMAAELLLCLAEDKPKMCLKVPNFVNSVVGLMVELMLTVEDDPGWLDKEDNSPGGAGVDKAAAEDDDEGFTRNYDVGENGLDRIANALGGEHVTSAVFGYVSHHIQQREWQHKFVAIMAISQTVEYLPAESCDAHLEEIVNTLLTHLVPPTDPASCPNHHRVRYVACQALGQIALDHRPAIQENYADKIIPALLATMDDAVPRVQAHAVAALINFVEEVDANDLRPFCDPLMEKLLRAVAAPGSSRTLREQSVTAIGCVAGVMEADFVKFCPVVMPLLSQILQNPAAAAAGAVAGAAGGAAAATPGPDASTSRGLTLLGKAIECVSIIGLSIPAEIFKSSSTDVMNALLAVDDQRKAAAGATTAAGGGASPGQAAADDYEQLRDYLNEAFCRLCRAMKADFVPFLPRLVPDLIKTISVVPQTLEAEDAADEEDMTFVTIAEGKYSGLKTSVIQEIMQATDTLHTFVSVVGRDFGPYLESTATALTPLLTFPFSDDVKRSALDGVSEVLGAWRQPGADEAGIERVRFWVSTVLEKVFEDLTAAAGGGGAAPGAGGAAADDDSDADVELMISQASGVARYLSKAGGGVLSSVQVGAICEKVFALLAEATRRRAALAEKKNEADLDEEDVARVDEEEAAEQTLRSSLLDTVGVLMQEHAAEFAASETAPKLCTRFIETNIHASCTPDDRALALYLADDVLRHLGDGGAALWPCFAERLIELLQDRAPAVRQAAAFGVIHAARCADFPEHLLQVAGRLLTNVAAELARNTEARKMSTADALAADNAVAALCSLILHRPAVLPQPAANTLSVFIEALPLRADEEEGQRVHADFLGLLAKNPTEVLGPGNARLAKVVAVCAGVYKTDFSTKATDEQIRHFCAGVGFEALERIADTFDQKLKRALKKIHRDVLQQPKQ